MGTPTILIEDWKGGYHNSSDYQARLLKEKAYQDLSTICLVPTRGVIPARVVTSWWGLMTPMNQKFVRMLVSGYEVGKAYSAAIEQILANSDLAQWKYVLTLEEDNIPPPDGLLKLYENMDKYDAIGGLYWTKGPGGQPMCYGAPDQFPRNFIPQIPKPEDITHCNGLGMGFTLFKMEMFKDARLPRPLFETKQVYEPGKGSQCYTQDLKFFEEAGKLGYKFACDSRVKVGHYSLAEDIVW